MSSKTCRECAKCCRYFVFAEVSQLEIEAIEDLTGQHYNMFTNPKGAEGEGRFLKFRENGDCIFLNRDDGTYSCVVYEVRPKVCRNYPSNQEQNETCYLNRNGSDPRDSGRRA
jgi:Fe-S-cluster containining protein